MSLPLLLIPDLALIEVDAELGRREPDEEVQELVVASAGLNLAVDFLPGSVGYDPSFEVDARQAARIVWLDAFVANVDRSARNTNLLVWHKTLWAIDHGVSLSAEPKLRTVLWGWAGERLPEAELERLERLLDVLATPEGTERLGALLPEHDVAALVARVDRLLRVGIHPHPSPGWPAVPWPPL